MNRYISSIYKDPHILGLMQYAFLLLYGIAFSYISSDNTFTDILWWLGLVIVFFVHIYNLFLFVKTIIILLRHPLNSFNRREEGILVTYTVINTIYILVWLFILIKIAGMGSMHFS